MLLIAVLTALKLLSFLVFINHHNTFGAINDPEPDSIKNKIALVEPTFTYAAYQNDSFYNFFHEYRPTPRNVDIVTDLDLLRDRVVPSEPFIHYKAPERGPTIPHGGFHRMVEEHVRAFAPESNITRIGDQHVHNGTIFQGQENVYDLLVLFHNEYLTQQEYDNLRRFVENGGTILFTMSNVLYAEVAYNEINNTITLVKGHDWEFDGNDARKNVSERWQEETMQWAGSNFLKMPTWMPVQFANNPFNYNHTEEQHVTNAAARILHDYRAQLLNDTAFNSTVASYEMDYGKGKVIMTGLFANKLVNNAAFWNFFDDIILPHAILEPLKELTVFQHAAAGAELTVYWKMKTGDITDMIVDGRSKSIHVSLQRVVGEDALLVTLPRDILSETFSRLEVRVNDVVTDYQMTECDSTVALEIPLAGTADQIRISYGAESF